MEPQVMKGNIVVFTGGFDPIHSGHIELIKEARKLGRVILGLNSDDWLIRKKGKPFMPFEERKAVLDQFKDILSVIGFDDSDNSACDAIHKAKEMFPKHNIIFVNGGDRTKSNIPEMIKYESDPLVEFAFSIGGDNKKNSSSWILSEWKHPSEERVWGKFMTYYDSPNAKVKRLVLGSGKSISMQYHNKRSEFWFVENGQGMLYTMRGEERVPMHLLETHQYHHVPVGEWHQLENTGKDELHIIEIQYGVECGEEDIVRRL